MNTRKPSFLERLTGAQIIDDDADDVVMTNNDGPAAKPWSKRVDANSEIDQLEEPTPTAAVVHEDERRNITDEEDNDESDDIPGLAIDIYESDNELVIQSMIAGVTPEHLQVTVARDSVIIRGKRVAPQGIPEEQYMTRELYWGEFAREIALPFEIDPDGAEAIEKYGLLIIRLPKLDVAHTAQLKVKSV